MLSVSVFGQDMKIYGNLIDQKSGQPAEKAVLVVIRLSDTLLVDFTRSDTEGKFDMNMPMDTVEVLISYPGTDDKSVFFFPGPGNLDLALKDLQLTPESDELGEILIVANKEPIYFRGDTLVYNADAFKTKENAVVEDLLKKLPGITVDKDGKISSQGREVNKILVDGDEFFGDDPTIATKNLGADGVESVEVYETENEDAEAGSDEKIQVMNLTLKEDAKQGYFGSVSAATDFQNYYEGEVLFNRFKGKRKVSIFALGTNTPRANFDWATANKFGLTNEYSGNQWNPTIPQAPQGVPRTFKTGIYFSDKLSDNIRFRGDYTYNNNELNTKLDQTSQFFLTDTTYYTDDASQKLEDFQSHVVNTSFIIDLDSLTELRVDPSFEYEDRNELTASQTSFRTANRDTTSTTNIFNSYKESGYEVNADVTLNRKFKKKEKRAFTFKYNFNLLDGKSDRFLHTISDYRFSPLLNQEVNQRQEQNLTINSHRGQLFFSEPLNEHFALDLDYLINHSTNLQGKLTNNFAQGEYNDLNSNLTNKFKTIRLLNRGGAKLRYNKSKLTVAVGTQFRNIGIDNVNLEGETINQNINNILPNAMLQYKFNKSKRLRIDYRTFSTQPSVTQLQPVPDNTNPNAISIGNLGLRPNYSHTLSANFNTWQALTGYYLWSYAYYTLTQDAFSTAVTYDHLGRTVSQTVNINGGKNGVPFNQNGGVFFGMGIPIKKVITITPGLNSTYFQNSNFINTRLNTTTTLATTGTLDFKYQSESDSLIFNLGASYSYSQPKSSLGFASQPFATTELRGGFEVELPWNMTLESKGIFTMLSQRSDGFNLNYFIWDAALSKRFLKTQNLILSIHGNDILNQNVLANRTVQDNVIVDNRTNIVSRYFLIKLTYKFNNTNTPENDGNTNW